MNRKKTNYFFKKGKISFVIDGAAGSSGKSLISSYLVKHSNNVDFLVSAFTPNASHTVIDDDGSNFVFKIFCGGTQYHEKLKAVYIADNAAIELKTLWKEIDYLKIPRSKVRISPRCAIVQQIDMDFEAGLCDLDGKYYSADEIGDGTILTGSTCSGSGAVLAKKVVRNKTLVVAKDIPELQEFLYPMDEIINRLEKGEYGLMEIAQGFPLSKNHHTFAPNTTSRNVTITNALNDAMLPPKYAGNVLLNWRTYPIKIHSFKYQSKIDGRFITWDEVQSNKIPYTKINSYSGDFYKDQQELSWEDITKLSGSDKPIMECTTLTKLPRRVATFSKQNLIEAIKFNDTGHNIFLCVNFCNYVQADLYRKRSKDDLSNKINDWLDNNILETIETEFGNKHIGTDRIKLAYLGTGECIEDRIELPM
jgi:hypothetical protein